MKVKGKLGNCTQVTVHGSLSVITTLEFLEHHFAKVGHRSSPYDPTLSLPTHLHTPLTSRTRKRLPQRGFVQFLLEEAWCGRMPSQPRFPRSPFRGPIGLTASQGVCPNAITSGQADIP